MNIESTKITEALDYIFKMRQDGRMDKEEAGLLLEIIFSDEMDVETLELIKFMYVARKKDELYMAEEDEKGWETVADFTNLPKGGIHIDEIIKALKELGEK